MPSVKNPNGPSKNRLAARATKAKSQRRKKSEEARNKISKADSTRGARPGLLPTSGPRATLSAKKARKLEKKMGYAMRRKMEAEGEAEMRDAPEVEQEEAVQRQIAEEDMEIR
ncbi:hypothetical protein JDV02_008352 [Purpureocillium takamizusanense]|uniref:Ribosome biogenesis protein ALB1 n=1 Tax=Purpureocillium takamizusanense TaxID=2060973 RepID=A0A9Q8QML2_9HYPO|nr:uncharacterized protein JDV02_008352 [Purpureocillium takamizusanense]UNI22463.1 hypothetical protein JDV02_008352 [Purpureocillium takamizusanense]